MLLSAQFIQIIAVPARKFKNGRNSYWPLWRIGGIIKFHSNPVLSQPNAGKGKLRTWTDEMKPDFDKRALSTIQERLSINFKRCFASLRVEPRFPKSNPRLLHTFEWFQQRSLKFDWLKSLRSYRLLGLGLELEVRVAVRVRVRVAEI